MAIKKRDSVPTKKRQRGLRKMHNHSQISGSGNYVFIWPATDIDSAKVCYAKTCNLGKWPALFLISANSDFWLKADTRMMTRQLVLVHCLAGVVIKVNHICCC